MQDYASAVLQMKREGHCQDCTAKAGISIVSLFTMQCFTSRRAKFAHKFKTEFEEWLKELQERTFMVAHWAVLH